MRIKNLPSILSMDGSQDALVIEQTDGSEDKSRKVSPAQIKQYVLGNSIDDIYSVMGQNGAKNLIPYPYYEKTHTENGITWTDNGDGTVTANGTATATSYFTITSRTLGTNMADSLIEGERYILTGCPTGGSNQKYDIFINETYNGAEVGMAFDYGNGATFTLNHKTENNYGIGLRIRSGQTVSNLTFKPMLRLASDSDNTYQPYAKTNRQLTEDKAELESVRDYVNELGVKNLIPYPYYRASGYSSNGMTTTYDSDGVLTINKEVGTSAAYFSLVNNNQSPYYFKANTRYRLTFELENANDLSIFLSYNGTDVGSIRNKSTGTYEVIFTTPQTLEGRENMAIYAGASGTETNAKVKVMIMLASDINDNTYVPYAMTNKQLTDEIQRILSRL